MDEPGAAATANELVASDDQTKALLASDMLAVNSPSMVAQPGSPKTVIAPPPPSLVIRVVPDATAKVATYNTAKALAVVYAINVVCEAARGIVIPVLFPYVQSMGAGSLWVGFAFAIFVVGRMISAMLLGWWAARRAMRDIFMVSMATAFAGNVLYFSAAGAGGGNSGIGVLMTARFVEGFATGVISCGRAFILLIVEPDSVTRYMAWASAAQFIGYSLAPGIASALSALDLAAGPFYLNAMTSSGYLLALLNLLLLVVIPCWVPAIEPKRSKKGECSAANCSVTAAALLFLYFVNRSIMAILETVGGQLYLSVHRLDPTSASSIAQSANFFLYMGLGGLVVYFSCDYLSKHVSNLKLMAISFAVTTIGSFLLAAPGLESVRFTTGVALIWSIASPMCQVVILVAFSEAIGKGAQNVMMGYFTVAGSVGSIFSRSASGVIPDAVWFEISGIASAVSTVAALALIYRKSRQSTSTSNA